MYFYIGVLIGLLIIFLITIIILSIQLYKARSTSRALLYKCDCLTSQHAMDLNKIRELNQELREYEDQD